MTHSQPPDPNRQRERDDERIAVFVALAAIGAILFWGLTRGEGGLRFAQLNPIAGIRVDDGEAERSPTDSGDAELDGLGLPEADGITDGIMGRIAEPLAGFTVFNPFRQDDAGEDGQRIQDEEPDTLTDAQLRTLPSVPSDGGADEDGGGVPTPDDTATVPDLDGDGDRTEALSPVEPIRPAIAFSDVADGFWAKPFIDSLSERGIISGFDDGSYQPDGSLTRAQFAASLNEAFSDGSPDGAIAYLDVAQDYWAMEAIRKATSSGFMSGYPEQVFLPDKTVTKLEVLVSLATGLNLPIPENPEAMLQMYGDRADIPEWAIEKIAAATQAGVVVNYPDVQRLNPNVPVTRAEASAIIYQAMASQGRVPALSSDYQVAPN